MRLPLFAITLCVATGVLAQAPYPTYPNRPLRYIC